MEIEHNQQQQNQQPQDTPFIGINGEQTGLGFSQRDQYGKTEEDSGNIGFTIITNDQTNENMKRLIDLKNIFSRQLPKMPKEYIVKLVFDRNHQAMIIHKNNGQKVIGGICFRQYPEQKFAEVAFLAITASEQVKGYGTRLMNKYKEYMQQQEIEYLLTYADNFAIGYFKKQGFTKEPKMPSERWKGFIKDYDGGTLMECYIHPFINYSNVSNLIKAQKQFVIDRIKQLCMNHKIYDPVNFKQFNKFDSIEEDKEHLEVNPEQIPGIIESGWSWEDNKELSRQKEKSFNMMCQNILDSMKRHKSVWPFLEPVNKDVVTDYFDIIEKPIDISTIEKKLSINGYQNKQEFLSDIKLIFENCRKFNQPDTIYYKNANELETYINPQLANFKESQVGTDDIRKNKKGKKTKY